MVLPLKKRSLPPFPHMPTSGITPNHGLALQEETWNEPQFYSRFTILIFAEQVQTCLLVQTQQQTVFCWRPKKGKKWHIFWEEEGSCNLKASSSHMKLWLGTFVKTRLIFKSYIFSSSRRGAVARTTVKQVQLWPPSLIFSRCLSKRLWILVMKILHYWSSLLLWVTQHRDRVKTASIQTVSIFICEIAL